MDSEIVIIGAGVTGLAAGIGLQDKAIILEKEDRVGGTVKSYCFDEGYWFDNVVHLLHVRNDKTRDWLMALLSDTLKLCPPIGYVETKTAKTHYPIQNNLDELSPDLRERCIDDIPEYESGKKSSSYREFLLNTFGKALCDLFFFPYNEKCWKYPLDDMVASGQTWNINKPSDSKTYNAEGYYPRPAKKAILRGMELLPMAMARKLCNIELGCEVLSIDLKQHDIWTNLGCYHYESECLSTIPLPYLARLCNMPASLQNDVRKLRWNKVISVALAIQGERPKNTGHWHYYADPKIPFSKLIYMTEFDEDNAPADGFGILLEIPESSNKHSLSKETLCGDVINLLEDLGILGNGKKILNCHTWEVNPAYVIFTKETPGIVDNCIDYFEGFGVKLLGRYGRWEYSSMAENIESGLNYASKYLKK